MSHLTELAREEADAVEAEELEDGAADVELEDAAGDVEENPEPPALDMAKAFDRMAREDERHVKRVAEIMGDDFQLVYPCAHCGELALGFTLTPPPTAPKLVADPETETCSRCDGWGEVLTGARADRSITRPCEGCGGSGWTRKVAQVAQLPATPPAAPVDPAAVAALRAAGYTIVEPYVPPAPHVA